jgi:hypothetical protein
VYGRWGEEESLVAILGEGASREVLGKGYITNGALVYVTRCRSRSPTHKHPGSRRNRRQSQKPKRMCPLKDPLNSAFHDGGALHRNHAIFCAVNHPPRAGNTHCGRTPEHAQKKHEHPTTNQSCVAHEGTHAVAWRGLSG